MADPASIAAIIGSVIAGVGGGWTAFNQHKNRKSGTGWDRERRAELAELKALVHEISSTLAVVGAAVGDVRGEVKALKAVVEIQGRTIERLQDRLDSRERKGT